MSAAFGDDVVPGSGGSRRYALRLRPGDHTRGRSKSSHDSQNPSFQRGGARGGGICRCRNHRRAEEVVIPMNRKAGVVRIRIKVMAVNAAVAIGALVATTGAPWKW